ncbi:hypothetical protein [uncultured Pseudomonas sp.]|uniref:hypothetical protein n=1 Tax=uncultured Pseudomonas sp. TaxID=114707 RepID=UPI0025E4539C|nr:hypothetical protein [uncultured Pseudomonas sp.]
MKVFAIIFLFGFVFSGMAWADEEQKIVQGLASCLLENAPAKWSELSVHYSRDGKDAKGRNIVSVNHLVEINGEFVKLEPCRPLVPSMLVEKLSSTLPVDSQNWKSVDISIFKTGEYKVNWNQP